MDKSANNTNEIGLKNDYVTDEQVTAIPLTTDASDNTENDSEKIKEQCDNTKTITEDSANTIKIKNNDQVIEKAGKSCEKISEEVTLNSSLNSETEVPNKISSEPHKVSKIADEATPSKRFARHSSWQDFFEAKKSTSIKIDDFFRRNRSHSDGDVVINNHNVDAFPSLPNFVLEEMSLPQKENTSDILEAEQKFKMLSHAFTVDGATVKDRCLYYQRSRDQLENKLTQEIENLYEKLMLYLQPFCTNFESAEMLTVILSQVEFISIIAIEVSATAERYGLTHHEERLTESVRLMINYVKALKQQRDCVRRQLQCAKKVLQERSSDMNLASPTSTQELPQVNTRRRATIANTNQSAPISKEGHLAKLNRRTSDLSPRASLLNKNARPNRLEMRGDLLKIKEDFSNEISTDANQSSPRPGNTAKDLLSIINSPSIVFRKTSSSQLLKKKSKEDFGQITEESGLIQVLRKKFKLFTKEVRKKLKNRFQNWSSDDYLKAFVRFCALLCFSISLVALVNIYVEYKYPNEA